MDGVKENNHEKTQKETADEIMKAEQQQHHVDNKLQQQHHHRHEELQEQVKEEIKAEIAAETLQQSQLKEGPQRIEYDEDADYEDDDEEKETSQKLVIDIPEDDEEEKEEEDEDDDVIVLDDLPQGVVTKVENEVPSAKLIQKIEATITLSDGEEETETISKPGKVQKRRSMGAGAANEEEHFRLKRRKINAAGAPKLPFTGYVRYMNDRRESLRKEHPSKTHMEHNKMIGEEWHSLPSDVKAPYLKAADVDKQRYVKELHNFLKARPDILASELAKNKVRKAAETGSPNSSAATATAASSTVTKTVLKDKPQATDTIKSSKDTTKDKMPKEIVPTPSTSYQAVDKFNNEKNKRKRSPTPPTCNTNNTNVSSSAAASISTSSSTTVNPIPGEIPIFTNEFLEHNKIYDMELRGLRKSKTDLEQQNSVLEKHVENMKFGVEKMITENNELEEKNRLLEIYLDKLKRKLALALGALPLPSAPNGATVDNIDKYMQDLYKMSTSNSTGPATLNKAKDIIRKLDLQIHL